MRHSIINNQRLLVLVLIVFLMALSRLLPHPPNVTPIMAMSLFAGAFFQNKYWAFLVPLSAMLISDAIIGFHSSMPFVYLGIIFTIFLGGFLVGNRPFSKVMVFAVTSSAVFFLVSNFGAWLTLPELYPPNLMGLQMAYIAAIPFYQNSLLADVVFTGLLFIGFDLLQNRYLFLRTPTV